MLSLAKLNDKPEIFYTIQGEGKNLGLPSVFVRLSLCNLYCIWCDTDYTWNWENTNFAHHNDEKEGYQKFRKSDYIIRLTTSEILNEVLQYNCKNIVLTGGEPLVQHKPLTELAKLLKNEGKHIEIETNGTIIPNRELDSFLDQYNVSIKLSNSKVETAERIVPTAISFFAQTEKSNFKFVIDSQGDLNEVLSIVQSYNIPHEYVYLMPQGTSPEALNMKQQWIIEICKQQGFNYTDRLHIHVYGSKRGV